MGTFLYRCVLQAVRIVALFHDVGHPPFSHIVEEVLEELYDELGERKNGDKTLEGVDHDKVEDFLSCMEKYKPGGKGALGCQGIYSNGPIKSDHLHEGVGPSFLQSVISEVVPGMIDSSLGLSSKNKKNGIAYILYYVIIVECVLGILSDRDPLLESLHRIVDGVIDSDRLDFIMRDSINSGVDWGKIPYKRLINSAKFVNPNPDDKDEEKLYAIAYPQKVAEDIEDLLLERYKIYARINFHHRSMKAAATLKSCVKQLALDYLMTSKNGEEKSISPEIRFLWQSLNSYGGNRAMRVIRWNDSWLISLFHDALIKIIELEDDEEDNEEKEEEMSEDEMERNERLRRDLEEILLNKKRYYTLMKRPFDNRNFVKRVIGYSGITMRKVREQYDREVEKYKENKNHQVSDDDMMSDPKTGALDSLERLKELVHELEKSGLEKVNLQKVDQILPSLEKCTDLTERVLACFAKKGRIIDSKVIENVGRRKDGLPGKQGLLDAIWLYENGEIYTYDTDAVLKPQIETIKSGVPWIHVYFVPSEEKDVKELADDLIDAISKSIGESFKERYEQLF